MTESKMQKFLVLYLVPASVMADWAKSDPAIRQVEEQKMMAAWGKWMSEHAEMIISTEAGGKTKRVTASGISDTKNDIILCSFVEAESARSGREGLRKSPAPANSAIVHRGHVRQTNVKHETCFGCQLRARAALFALAVQISSRLFSNRHVDVKHFGN